MKDKQQFPTLFRGVFWDDGWEYDAPCVVYSPFKRYGCGGNSHTFMGLVEDICINICLGKEPPNEWSEASLKEFQWRRWSPQGFSRRKQAWHLECEVRWFEKNGEQHFEITWFREKYGPDGEWEVQYEAKAR